MALYLQKYHYVHVYNKFNSPSSSLTTYVSSLTTFTNTTTTGIFVTIAKAPAKTIWIVSTSKTLDKTTTWTSRLGINESSKLCCTITLVCPWIVIILLADIVPKCTYPFPHIPGWSSFFYRLSIISYPTNTSFQVRKQNNDIFS